MKQTEFFETPKELALVLHEPPYAQWMSMTSLLENRCNKQELLKYAEAFIPWLSKYPDIMRATVDGHIVRATECTEMFKNSSLKQTIAQGIALILADNQNLATYVDSISTEVKTLWRIVLFNIFVTQKTAKQILKTTNNLFSQQRSYYSSGGSVTWNKREYGWFSIANYRSAETDRYGYREYESYITVNSFVRSIFFPVFFPEAFETDTSLQELPDNQWRVFNLETESLSQFHLFTGLVKQGAFPLKKKGIATADMKRAQKKLVFTEFFPGDHNEYRENLRAFSYMQMLALHEYQKTGSRAQIDSYEDNLRDLIVNFSNYIFFLPGILYPHIKGLRRQMTEYSRDVKLCKMMFDLLREEPERWVGIHDIFLKITALESSDNTLRYTTLVFHPNDEQYASDIVNEYSGRKIVADRYTQEYGYTGLQVCAFLLASLGIVEIALNEDESRDISPFDSLDYVRLTDLGRYALGLTDYYEAPEMEHTAYFELDPDRLIIRSLVTPNPYAQLLLDTSKPISSNRYETSALSFLANCRMREDVESKISIFKQFIASELPPLWEQFFQKLLQHCHPLKADTTNYRHYTLDPDNRDLVTLITTDPVLRKIVIRAEGYRIMVRSEDLQKFENQLKKHGYLL